MKAVTVSSSVGMSGMSGTSCLPGKDHVWHSGHTCGWCRREFRDDPAGRCQNCGAPAA